MSERTKRLPVVVPPNTATPEELAKALLRPATDGNRRPNTAAMQPTRPEPQPTD